MNQSIRLGRVAGIPIGINWSVLLIAALIGWSLAASALPEVAPGETNVAYAVAGTAAAILFFASLLAHELAHALVARRDGVSVHSITLWLLGGVSRFESDPPSADSELRISIAGPLTSLALALSFGLLERLSEAGHLRDLVSGSLAWLAVINLVLGVFNLLPAYPLDGGRVLRALAWRHSRDRVAATRVAARTGHVLAWCLIGLGMLVALTGLVVSGLWLVLIGWFIDNAGRAEAAAVVERSVLGAVPVDRLMSADPVTVPGSLSVERLVHDYVLGRHHSAFPVTDEGGATIGLVTLDQVRGVPTERRGAVTVTQVALPLDQVPVVAPTDSGVDALQRITATRSSRALVMDADRGLVGIVSNSDLTRALDVGSVGSPATTAPPPPPVPPSRR